MNFKNVRDSPRQILGKFVHVHFREKALAFIRISKGSLTLQVILSVGFCRKGSTNSRLLNFTEYFKVAYLHSKQEGSDSSLCRLGV